MTKKNDTKDEPAEAGNATRHASNRPIWSQTLNRVECSIWKHDHDGEARYSVSICRSYFEKKSGKVVRSHYFDEQDLPDVVACANAAGNRLLLARGLDIQADRED